MFSTDIYHHPTFIQNKYFELYKRLIEADYREEYMETHHILPRCLGGTNDSLNLKSITARIHFLAHYLLTKFVEKDTLSWHKVVYAFNCMKMSPGNTPRYFNSRLYEANRKHVSLASKNSMWITDGSTNKRIKKDADIPDGWTKGQYTSEETKKKMSLAKIGKTPSEETRAKISLSSTDRTHSEESRKKMSLAKSGRTPSEETKSKLRLANIGKPRSEETRAKISLYNKNSTWITDGTINKRINKDADIADGWVKGYYTSEETRAKISLAKIGRTHSEEAKEKLSLASKNTMWITDGTENKKIKTDAVIPDGFYKGNYTSEESRAKIRLAKIGKTPSEETKAKLSLASKNSMWITDGVNNKKIKKDAVIPDGWFKGYYISEEAKEKMSLAKIGKTHSEETRKKMSLAKIGKTHSEETRTKMSLAKKKPCISPMVL